MKIIFTSCMDAERAPQQPIWAQIKSENPDVLMLLGDQIYMDWGDLGASGWLKAIQKNEALCLKAFATEMHSRYALQWGVDEFRGFICQFSGRSDASKLLITWDDHDFAWNNAVNDDGSHHDDVKKHGVTVAVKQISYRLFKQFENQLREADENLPYPALPTDFHINQNATDDGLYWQGKLAGNGPDCVLLDTRWHRQARTKTARILGDTQLQELIAQGSAHDKGLLIVAAGTPMAYKYRLSQQAWYAYETPDEDHPPYIDYDAVLTQARRPVLFLGGDVHKNQWSGRLLDLKGNRSRVVQVLSSGAAIGNIGPKRFAPSYGVLELPGTADNTLKVRLLSMDKQGAWTDHPPVGDIAYTNTDWVDRLDGIAETYTDVSSDELPITVLCARKRDSKFNHHKDAQTPLRALDDLDEIFKTQAQDSGALPEPWLIQSPANGSVQMTFQGQMQQGDQREHEISEAMTSAFDRALARGAASVVLFIHGMGKTFSQSVAQAYQLRQSFPACEPILYSWESGSNSSAVSALMGVGKARTSAALGYLGLAKVMAAFGAIAARPKYRGLTKIIIARSAGSIAMHEALMHYDPNFSNQINAVDRVVLSAPLVKVSEFNDRKSFSSLSIPIVITRNKNDQTLKFADWIDGFGPVLGLEEGWATERNNHYCIDFSDCARVGSLHDYLFLDVSPKQRKVNEQLLSNATFNPAIAPLKDMLDMQFHGVFNVRGG